MKLNTLKTPSWKLGFIWYCRVYSFEAISYYRIENLVIKWKFNTLAWNICTKLVALWMYLILSSISFYSFGAPKLWHVSQAIITHIISTWAAELCNQMGKFRCTAVSRKQILAAHSHFCSGWCITVVLGFAVLFESTLHVSKLAYHFKLLKSLDLFITNIARPTIIQVSWSPLNSDPFTHACIWHSLFITTQSHAQCFFFSY